MRKSFRHISLFFGFVAAGVSAQEIEGETSGEILNPIIVESAKVQEPQNISFKFDVGFSFPRFIQVDVSKNVSQLLKGPVSLGMGWGLMPLSGLLQKTMGGFETSWSDDYNLWVEPRFDSFSWNLFSDWQMPASGWGLRADFMVQVFRLGGLAHLQNKETKVASPVLDLRAFYTQISAGLWGFYSWGQNEKPWRLSFGLSYRMKSFISIQSGGAATLLTDLDSQYREAFDDGLDIAENELSRDLNNISALPRFLPSLGVSKTF